MLNGSLPHSQLPASRGRESVGQTWRKGVVSFRCLTTEGGGSIGSSIKRKVKLLRVQWLTFLTELRSIDSGMTQ